MATGKRYQQYRPSNPAQCSEPKTQRSSESKLSRALADARAVAQRTVQDVQQYV